ncbi:MAG: glutaredoxin [Myxococcota bacterium]
MPTADDLTLYHYASCGFCRRVFFTLRDLGIDIADKDILRDPVARQELMAARGRTTVPVLRIRRDDGPDQWLPESADIIRFLHDELA